MEQKKIRLLRPDEIECRIGTISEKGLSLLLFMDARAAQNILDESFTSFGWRRTHQEIGGRLYCTVEVWDGEKKQWINKQDVGTESFAEKEKGAASDSFKRACFNWGIGRELYSAPFIWIPADRVSIQYDGKRYSTPERFTVAAISYNENREICGLEIRNGANRPVFVKRVIGGEKKQWINKQDVGTESFAEKEKGAASDSFKRACFNWGIGRELYSAPFIWIPADRVSIQYDGKRYSTPERFTVAAISYNENREICGLEIRNGANRPVFVKRVIGEHVPAANGETKQEVKEQEPASAAPKSNGADPIRNGANRPVFVKRVIGEHVPAANGETKQEVKEQEPASAAPKSNGADPSETVKKQLTAKMKRDMQKELDRTGVTKQEVKEQEPASAAPKSNGADPSETVKKQLTAKMKRDMQKELDRTGVALEKVLKRYHLADITQMTAEQYRDAMTGLKRSQSRTAA